MRDVWEEIAFGEKNLPPLPRVGVLRRLRGIRAYAEACELYRRDGFPAAREFLLKLKRASPGLPTASTRDGIRLARRAAPLLSAVGMLKNEQRLCLPRATSLAAGLIAMGLHAQVALGKLAEDNPVAFFKFHAWVEIDGTPVELLELHRHYNLLTLSLIHI